VDEISEGLGPGGPLVKIGALSSKRVRGDHALGLEPVVAHGTKKLDLT